MSENSFLQNSVCWYVVLRDRQKQKLFYSDRDYEYYLRLLKKYKRSFQVNIFAFCLLPIDVQLIVQPKCADRLGPFLENVNEAYRLFFNTKNEPANDVEFFFHRNVVIDNDRELIERVKYVECLPMGALISSTMAGYPWSSCSHRVGGKAPLIDKTSFSATFFPREYSPLPQRESVFATIRKWQRIFI